MIAPWIIEAPHSTFILIVYMTSFACKKMFNNFSKFVLYVKRFLLHYIKTPKIICAKYRHCTHFSNVMLCIVLIPTKYEIFVRFWKKKRIAKNNTNEYALTGAQ